MAMPARRTVAPDFGARHGRSAGFHPSSFSEAAGPCGPRRGPEFRIGGLRWRPGQEAPEHQPRRHGDHPAAGRGIPGGQGPSARAGLTGERQELGVHPQPDPRPDAGSGSRNALHQPAPPARRSRQAPRPWPSSSRAPSPSSMRPPSSRTENGYARATSKWPAVSVPTPRCSPLLPCPAALQPEPRPDLPHRGEAIAGRSQLSGCHRRRHRRPGHRLVAAVPRPSGAADRPGRPRAASAGESRSGSAAALGVLMAQVFQRSRGRAWRLRQTSLSLWAQWRQELAGRGCPIPFQAGSAAVGAGHRRRRAAAAAAGGTPGPRPAPELVGASSVGGAGPGRRQPGRPPFRPGRTTGSPGRHGRLSPRRPAAGPGAGQRPGAGTGAAADRAGGCTASQQPRPWRPTWLVVAAGLASEELLAPSGTSDRCSLFWASAWSWRPPCRSAWPCPVVWQGLNLVPRPGGGLWLGATLEPGGSGRPAAAGADAAAGRPSPWLRLAGGGGSDPPLAGTAGQARRPTSPVAGALEPGLLLLCGHYRNGVLLAPASAQWAVEQIESFPYLSLTYSGSWLDSVAG